MQGTTYLTVKYLLPAVVVVGLLAGGFSAARQDHGLAVWLQGVPWWGWVVVGPLAVSAALAVLAQFLPVSRPVGQPMNAELSKDYREAATKGRG